MLKPPHPVARAAYALAMAINPNNHARDGGRASSAMEIEAVAAIAGHVRLDGITLPRPFDLQRNARQPRGALGCRPGCAGQKNCRLRAGPLHPPAHLRRAQAALRSMEADARGRISLDALEAELRKGDVGTVVVTMGTTAIGAVDPLDQILALRAKYGFRIHVDAAYGGYFKLTSRGSRRACRGGPSRKSTRQTRSSSIPTSTGCSLTGAGACCSATPPWAGFTSTTRLIHISLQRNCTLARSAWSAPARGPAQWRCGPPSVCCR